MGEKKGERQHIGQLVTDLDHEVGVPQRDLNLGVGLPKQRLLELASLDGQRRTRLPADPNIRIERARITAGQLELHGEAQVSP